MVREQRDDGPTDTLDKGSPVPIYHQLQKIILRNIDSGTWAPHDLIPSERELSEKYAVSRMTVRQALNNLTQQGVLRREVGKGTYVAQPTISQTLDSLTGFSSDMRARGRRPFSRLVRLQALPAPATAARALGLARDSELVLVERVRLADDEPIALETSHLWFPGCQRLLDEDLSGSLYEVLGRYGLSPVHAEQQIGAGLSTRREADLLGIAQRAAVLHLKRTVFDQHNRPFEYVESTYCGDRYTFNVELISTACHRAGAAPDGN